MAKRGSAAHVLRRSALHLILEAQRLDPIDAMPTDTETPGAVMVAKERMRQITHENYTPERDARYGGPELAWAAYCYLERAAQDRLPQDDPSVPHVWPWPRQGWRPKNSRVRNLTIAAALIVAEIDRLWAEGETQ